MVHNSALYVFLCPLKSSGILFADLGLNLRRHSICRRCYLEVNPGDYKLWLVEDSKNKDKKPLFAASHGVFSVGVFSVFADFLQFQLGEMSLANSKKHYSSVVACL